MANAGVRATQNEIDSTNANPILTFVLLILSFSIFNLSPTPMEANS